MRNSIGLYWRYVSLSLRSQMQYRVSFFLLTFAYFVQTGIEFFAIWALFHRFETLQGWSLPEVALLYGITNVSFSLAEVTSRGFDLFGQMVNSGDFDTFLLRPRSTLLQVAGQEFALMRLGRLFQGGVVLVWALFSLPLLWTPSAFWLMAFAILSGTALFYALFVMQAVVCFWSIEGLEFMNIFTFGGTEVGKYPMSIYKEAFRLFFTCVIPLACVIYFPMSSLLEHGQIPYWLGCLAPCAAWLFLGVAIALWHWGVRHYRSSGS